MTGKVYLIGAGPGDPGLITLRGVHLLGLADVVLYDALAHPALLRHARPGAELRSVGKRYGEESFSQDAINAELVELAQKGLVVARLKGGDPLLFARGAEEAETLAAAHIPFEIVPGIPSPSGAAAYAGISLTHRDLSSSVAFITGTESPGKERTAHDWSKLATATQTLCIIMGMKRLGEITQALIDHGRDPQTPALVIQWGTWAKQKVVEGPLDQIAELTLRAKVANPSVVVIGQVASRREGMRWFDRQPLFGKRILLTRPENQAEETARDILARGAEPLVVPMIRVVPPPDIAAFEKSLGELDSYDLVAFTSTNGVVCTMDALYSNGRDARAFGRAKIGAIGAGTASALLSRGLVADVVAEEYRGEGLAAAILEALNEASEAHGAEERPSGRPKRVLILRALVGREALPTALRAAGLEVDVTAAYQTRAVTSAKFESMAADLAAQKIDVVTFTSGSAVRELVTALGREAKALLAHPVVAAIGPVTADVAHDLGLRVDVVADPCTVSGLLDALERHFAAS